MLNYENYAITLGRAVDVFRTAPDDTVRQKGALRALVALSSIGAVALRIEDDELHVGGRIIPPTLPFVNQLVDRFTSHRVRRVNVSRGASASDLLRLLRAVTGDDVGVLDETFEDFRTIGLDLIKVKPEILMAGHRPAAVSSAFDREEVLSAAGENDPEATVEMPLPEDPEKTLEIETVAAPVGADSATPSGAPPAAGPEAEDPEKTVELETVAPPPEQSSDVAPVEPAAPGEIDQGDAERRERLSLAMLKLAAAGLDDDVGELVEAVVAGVELELEAGDDEKALEGIASIVNLEAEAPRAEREMYTGALLRVLTPETLVRVARLVSESRHTRYAVAVLHRAGRVGTDALIEQLVKAPSQEEMDAFGAALPALKYGVEKLEGLLKSDEPQAVSVGIAQLARLNVTGAAGSLADLAATAKSDAVRNSAGGALLELEQTDVVVEAVDRVLRSDSPGAITLHVTPKISDRFADRIVAAAAAATKPDAKRELCQALGMIGSPSATRQLIRMSSAGGRFFGRKPVSGRIAAIEGLAMLSGPAARGQLEELAHDRNSDIRAAAKAALEKAED